MNPNVRRGAAILVLSACFAQAAFAATPVEETQALIQRGDLDGALKRIDRFLASSPQDAEGRFTRALILVKQNKLPDAIKAFTDLTHDYPQLPEPYNNLAVLYAQSGDYEKARDALEAALATNPSYATAHENLGDIYAALAGAAYNRALALDQTNQATRYKLSLINQVGAGPAANAPAAAAKPATPAAAATPVTAGNQAVLTALDAWALAWSNRNIEAYLAAYAPDFQPDGGLSRSDWANQRRARIAKPKSISVHLIDPEVETIDAQHVRVVFTQDYQSDTISDKITKSVDLRDVGGSWKIVRETIR
ncbi:MAG: hypothetical protein NVS9B10_01820 [Nevskia sp.]